MLPEGEQISGTGKGECFLRGTDKWNGERGMSLEGEQASGTGKGECFLRGTDKWNGERGMSPGGDRRVERVKVSQLLHHPVQMAD